MTAKATALAGAAVAGLWFGLLAFVLPDSALISAARSDTLTAVVGLFCAAIMVAGALYLEFCCRAPEDPRDSSTSR
jgi:arginine exporter protein ArgO